MNVAMTSDTILGRPLTVCCHHILKNPRFDLEHRLACIAGRRGKFVVMERCRYGGQPGMGASYSEDIGRSMSPVQRYCDKSTIFSSKHHTNKILPTQSVLLTRPLPNTST